MTSPAGERGSGARRWKRMRAARRVAQGVSLVLFLYLIAATASLTGAGFDASTSAEVPYPVEAFLLLDPLAGAMTLLGTGTIPTAMLLGLVTLGSAMLLGRAFCGWICPLGTLNHIVGAVGPKPPARRRMEANRTRPYQKIKYGLLVFALLAALAGSAIGGLIDPISLATRGISQTVLPWMSYAVGGAVEGAAESGVPAVQHASDALYDGLEGVLFYQRSMLVSGGFLVAVVFLAVLIANRWIFRFWCRGLCPLGAMLGVSGRFGLLALEKDAEACSGCNRCQLVCSGAASPRPQDRWQRAECDLCMNCVAVCPDDALAFRLAGRAPAPESPVPPERPLPDVSRRALLASAAAGLALVPAARTGGIVSARGRPGPECIRPPGSLAEPEFLERCVRCGQCIKICPQNALHPALDEAGLEGLWTPVLVPRAGYCEPTCTLCTQVCPTAAIRRVTEAEKTGADGERMVRIGTAFVDRGRCLPWAMGIPCTVCEEFCPIAPKAIWLEEVEVPDRDGGTVTLKRPYVDPAQCNGCGACEHVCPVHDRAAIRVTSAGETRSRDNQLLLADDG